MRRYWLGVAAAGLFLLPACTHTVKVEPIEVKPIHLTVDVNLKVDRALDDFFAFEDKYEEPAPQDDGAKGGE